MILRRGEDVHARRRARMVEHDLRARGLHDERVLAAMAQVPRERFVPEHRRDHAYDDNALPIGEGQTISQPYVVAAMLEALELGPDDRLLEVGAGSGYVVAIAAALVREVVGVERIDALTRRAAATLDELGIANAAMVTADGTLGWPAGSPYDAILVSAGGPDVPDALLDQLAPGGRLVMPIGRQDAQHLVRVRRTATGVERDELGGVLFVPLIGEQGWPDPPA